ncbi:MAG: 6-phosphogluconolactonase [Ferruginibacter sp.]
MNKVCIFNDEEEVSKAAAAFILEHSKKSIENKGRFTIALSGGKTPSLLYNLLAQLPYSKELHWKTIFIFWGDERCVPHDSDQNNSHMAKKLLLDHVPIPRENIFPVQVQMQAGKAALQYEQMLKVFFKQELPVFDLILLGMGEDGHTASLFPGTETTSTQSLVNAVKKPADQTERITFTPQLINNAKQVLFLVTGKNKADILKEVLENKSKNKYPVQLIHPKNGKTLWYADKPAATLLKKIK